MSVTLFKYFNKIQSQMVSKHYVNPVKTSLLGLAVSEFMKDYGLKTAYVRQECQIGSTRLNSFKKGN
jgi:hypothetical protein